MNQHAPNPKDVQYLVQSSILIASLVPILGLYFFSKISKYLYIKKVTFISIILLNIFVWHIYAQPSLAYARGWWWIGVFGIMIGLILYSMLFTGVFIFRAKLEESRWKKFFIILGVGVGVGGLLYGNLIFFYTVLHEIFQYCSSTILCFRK